MSTGGVFPYDGTKKIITLIGQSRLLNPAIILIIVAVRKPYIHCQAGLPLNIPSLLGNSLNHGMSR
jgi:hypothetical protein